MIYIWCSSFICIIGFTASLTIVAPECNPPDFPSGGGYGPRQEFYVVGDVIYYYCDTKNYIGGNFYRRCEDDGAWLGDTPVCDYTMEMQFVNQTSTARPEDENEAFFASDGDQTSCSSTTASRDTYWMGLFKERGELIRVMVFMRQGQFAYKVLLLKSNGSEISCGNRRSDNALLGWQTHNCPVVDNKDAIGLKIKSLSTSIPLQICEIRAHVLTSPTCIDPLMHINYGRLNLTRKTASLVCDKGFIQSPETQIECIHGNVWNDKSLYCQEQRYDLGERENTPDRDP